MARREKLQSGFYRRHSPLCMGDREKENIACIIWRTRRRRTACVLLAGGILNNGYYLESEIIKVGRRLFVYDFWSLITSIMQKPGVQIAVSQHFWPEFLNFSFFSLRFLICIFPRLYFQIFHFSVFRFWGISISEFVHFSIFQVFGFSTFQFFDFCMFQFSNRPFAQLRWPPIQ